MMGGYPGEGSDDYYLNCHYYEYEAHREAYDWKLIELDMPWGRKRYIYQGRTINGYPESVMHYDDVLGWQLCPNINVHKRIKERMAENGR
jgi:hypothetical protein